jgi:hypothetical protein
MLSVVMLSVIMLSVVMLSVVMLSVVMLSVFMLNVANNPFMLSDVMVNATLLNVVPSILQLQFEISLMIGCNTFYSIALCNIRQFKQRTKVYLGRHDYQHYDIQHNDHNDMNITKNKSRHSS